MIRIILPPLPELSGHIGWASGQNQRALDGSGCQGGTETPRSPREELEDGAGVARLCPLVKVALQLLSELQAT